MLLWRRASAENQDVIDGPHCILLGIFTYYVFVGTPDQRSKVFDWFVHTQLKNSKPKVMLCYCDAELPQKKRSLKGLIAFLLYILALSILPISSELKFIIFLTDFVFLSQKFKIQSHVLLLWHRASAENRSLKGVIAFLLLLASGIFSYFFLTFCPTL